MKTPRHDYYALEHAITFGIRPQFTVDDSDQWEVYVKLTNGNRVTVARDGNKQQATKHLTRLLQRLAIGEPERALVKTIDGAYIDALQIIRVYLDAQPEGYAAIVEDSLGEGYRLAEGDKEACRDAVLDAVQSLAVLHALQEDEEPD